MGDLLYMAGSGYNQLVRCTTAPVAGSTLSGFSVASLYDGLCGSPFIFDGTAGANWLNIDLNQTINGDFSTAFSGGHPGEDWGAVGTPACTKVSNSMQIAGAAGDNYEYHERSCAAGEVLTLHVFATPPTGAGGSAKVIVRNMETGSTLTNAGLWLQASSGQAVWLNLASAPGGAPLETTFTVQDFDTCGTDRVTIRIEFYGGPGLGPTYPTYDEFYLWPRINFVFGHNHNLPVRSGLQYRSGATAAPSTLVHSFSLARPTFFGSFSDQDFRYARLIVTNDPADSREVHLWQLVLGQVRTASRQHLNGHVIALTEAQDRSSSDVGPQQAYIRGAYARRQVEMQFSHPTAASLAEHAEIMKRSRNGAYPLVVALDSDDATSALMARTSQDWKRQHVVSTLHNTSLPLEEFPFGQVTG